MTTEAQDVISPGAASYYPKYFRGLSSSRDPAFKWATASRELAPRPADRPSAEASCGCGGGSGSEPTPQKCQGAARGEVHQSSADLEVSEDENATNEAKPESTQGMMEMEVTSNEERHGDDERTQSSRLGDGATAGERGRGWKEETGGGDHGPDEFHESAGRRREEAAYLPRDTGNGNPERMSRFVRFVGFVVDVPVVPTSHGSARDARSRGPRAAFQDLAGFFSA